MLYSYGHTQGGLAHEMHLFQMEQLIQVFMFMFLNLSIC